MFSNGEAPEVPLQRLFFALWPDEALQERLYRLGGELAEQYRGRRVPRENLHLTLAFIGEVTSEGRECLEEQAGYLRVPPFTLKLEQLGHFRRPRVIWLGSEETPQPLLSLVDGLNEAQARCGFDPERRPFATHLTLLRKAQHGPRMESCEPLIWPVEDFALVVSDTRPEGARYTVLRRWRLTA